MNRRKFVEISSSLAAGMVVSPLAYGSTSENFQEQDYPIIDTHQHLWGTDKFRLHWLRPPIDKGEFMIPEYRREVDGLNVVKTIYMEVDVPVQFRAYEAQFALDLCEDPASGMVGAVIYGHPDDDGFRNFVSKFSGSPKLKGVRCRGNKERLFSKKALKNLKWLGDEGLLFDLGVNPTWLVDCVDIVKECPATTFILNHCGNADPVALFPEGVVRPRPPKYDASVWKRGIAMLGEQENVVCKISGIVAQVRNFELTASHLAPTVNYCLDAFGPSRVIFAGDWPTCLYNMPLRQWITTLKEIVRPRSYLEQKKLFHDNAERIYAL